MEQVVEYNIKVVIRTNEGVKVTRFGDPFMAVQHLVRILSDEQRTNILNGYCRDCGTDNPDCQCWNDE